MSLHTRRIYRKYRGSVYRWRYGIQVAVPLKKAVDNKGAEVFKSFEKNVVLYLIDDAWKEHLREMDELKQSVQNAVYEQKDPLLVYKFEAFELFRQMLATVNKELVSFLFRGGIPVQQEPEEIREARPQPKSDMKNLRTSKPELVAEANGMPMEDYAGGAKTNSGKSRTKNRT